MSCRICGDPKVVAKSRCHCCYEYKRRTGDDRGHGLVSRLTERDIEREHRRRQR